ncbi:PEP-CTERM protein-sorting domain-containing protein [Nitrosospira sp. Nl5]|uniref:PEP-CTERM sorting domain-containing protein n=1 Tax=Nitrosospira sp. Nl5 TaxID=200120 RepID=UPI00088F5B4C|nr:PEP-CTERM sorting domain-containing protein [Nitrosospira sp. Nl5]SCY32043.1 PEP-CTERM protein-sorting domain-containing protein [Nitrosospira sp. Nl5]
MQTKLILGALSAVSLGLPSLAAASPVLVRSAGGDSTPASINAARDQFRVDLGGGTVAGPNGLFGDARREINWDGTPDGFSAPNNLPGNFFNSNSPRGAEFSTPGTGVQVSANSGIAPVEFDNINSGYSSTFGVFSSQRLFTGVDSNVVDVSFFLPGTTTPALVSGFGAVFTDVDLTSSTKIEFFDAANASLGIYAVPVGTVDSESLSFLGVSFTDGPIVSRVQITSGNTALGAGVNDGAPFGPDNIVDLVAMDDFIYAAPVPEPETYAMLLAGLGLIGAISRRRKVFIN